MRQFRRRGRGRSSQQIMAVFGHKCDHSVVEESSPCSSFPLRRPSLETRDRREQKQTTRFLQPHTDFALLPNLPNKQGTPRNTRADCDFPPSRHARCARRRAPRHAVSSRALHADPPTEAHGCARCPGNPRESAAVLARRERPSILQTLAFAAENSTLLEDQM